MNNESQEWKFDWSLFGWENDVCPDERFSKEELLNYLNWIAVYNPIILKGFVVKQALETNDIPQKDIEAVLKDCVLIAATFKKIEELAAKEQQRKDS